MNDTDLGQTNLVQHNISLQDPVPVNRRRIPPIFMIRYDNTYMTVQDILDAEVIRPGQIPFASSVVLVDASFVFA